MKDLITFLVMLVSSVFISAQAGAQSAAPSAEAQKMSIEVVRLFQQKKYAEALPLAKQAVSKLENELGKRNLALASAWRNLAYIQYSLGQKEEAEDSAEKSFSIFEKNQPLSQKDQRIYIEMIETAATFNALNGDFFGAEKKYQRAIELAEKSYGPDSAELSDPLSKLAQIYEIQTFYEKAAPLLTRALEVRTRKDNKLDEPARDIYDVLHCLLTKLKREDERHQLQKRFFPSPGETVSSQPAEPKTINAGVVNGKGIDLAKPAYPAEARAKRIEGDVSVQVLIDETGKVISACAISGDRELHRGSEAAALQSKFSPTTLQGNPVKVSGIIVYKYHR